MVKDLKVGRLLEFKVSSHNKTRLPHCQKANNNYSK